MNTGLVIEVLIASVVVLFTLSLFTLHYTALQTLLLNEKETRKILHLVSISDSLIDGDLAVEAMGIKLDHVVDCSKLTCTPDVYVKCGPYVCGSPDGKLIIRRRVLYGGIPTYVEVGIP